MIGVMFGWLIQHGQVIKICLEFINIINFQDLSHIELAFHQNQDCYIQKMIFMYYQMQIWLLLKPQTVF